MFTLSQNQHRSRSRSSRRSKLPRRTAEQLEDRRLLASVTFSYVGHLGLNARTPGVTTGDFSGDGIVDIAAAHRDRGEVSVSKGNGDGTFQSPTRYRVGSEPFGLASADLDGDGNVDLVSANRNSSNVTVMLNDGQGMFTDRKNYRVNVRPGSDVVIADFNADQLPDLAVSSSEQTVQVLFGQRRRLVW